MTKLKRSKPRVSSASKKVIAFATAAALTLSIPAAVFADKAVAVPTAGAAAPASDGAVTTTAVNTSQVEASIAKDKAVSIARGLLAIPDTYTLQSASLSTNISTDATVYSVWNLSFVYKVDGKSKGSISASLDANSGELTGYNSYTDNPNAKPVYPPKVNREQAVTVAQSFIKKAAASYANQLQLDEYVGVGTKPPLTGEVVHRLRFDRMVNGVPFNENFIEFQIDGEGHVLSYERNWNSGIKFEKATAAFTQEEAATKLQAAAKPSLNYTIPYDMKPRKPILVYNINVPVISAVTGDVISASSKELKQTQLSDKPLGEKPSGTKQLTKEQASAKVDAAFKLPEGAKLTSSEFSEYADDLTGKTRSSWQLGYTYSVNGDKEREATLWAQVDGETGQIMSYSNYGNSDRTGAGVSYADARAKAVEALRSQLAWAADEYYLEENEDNYKDKKPEEIGSFYFSASRKVHGASVDGESAQISINAFTGQVENYWNNVSGFEFPAESPSVIGDVKAADAWMDFYRVELTYVTDYTYYWNGQPIPVEKYKVLLAAGEAKPSELSTKGEAQLVYRLVPRYVMDQSVALDAETGNWISLSDGQPASLDTPRASDVEGHWAQRELELMVAYKALDLKDGKVNPSAVITRGEMIKMLVLAMNQGNYPMYSAGAMAKDEAAAASFSDVGSTSNYFPYVELALQQQLIDIGDGTFNPEGKVDREEMAELIVRALGFNALAEHDNLFNVQFSDAAKTKQKGQAAIAVGLGIMSLQNGKFLPEKQVTRAEASVAFFRFLQAKADLREAPLRDE
ncbi:S-layer homology domain-containing protein [Paenibacillus kobensis]|uniref:S-layer homology domain-containing protein n=1 Tax=Paenibacillus kobensis TaxID=59841 RepID=UPI0013E3B145|nr:S-layer homology domain-containing protein [Paenibacillus kobensis]